MTSSVQLGALEGDAAKPVLRASADGIDFLIELDNGALLKLAGRTSLVDWKLSIEAQRARIRSAAQDLYDNGFMTNDEMPRLFVTALDIV